MITTGRLETYGTTDGPLDLFEPASTSELHRIEKAEALLLDVADYIYTHTSLKPMSKTLFLVSRLLLALTYERNVQSVEEATRAYQRARAALGRAAPADDFSLKAVLAEARDHLPYLIGALVQVQSLTAGTDSLGLVFNTLLRGKWESGEGLGTFLTPEEVVGPMVEMIFAALEPSTLQRIGTGEEPLLAGDICGGTGRFVYHMARGFRARNISQCAVENATQLFDQSCLAVDFAKLNFVFEGLHPMFDCVGDSLTDERLRGLNGRFAALATNPPFGTGKYRWSPAVERSIQPEILTEAGLTGEGTAADPAFLFTFRNLDLLAPGGVLGIVLPDGVLHSPAFRRALSRYEDIAGRTIEVLAIVSLPASSFALGGTVAKTSFVIFKRDSGQAETPLYIADAKHIGFKKRGNRRVPDAAGNDLVAIARGFAREDPSVGNFVGPWRNFTRLSPAEFHASVRTEQHGPGRKTFSSVVGTVRDYQDHPAEGTRFHVSILDVDELGQIDIVSASRNAPVTRSIACKPGDLILSCLNPKIWRASIIPTLPGVWTCSPEFAVLRPKQGQNPWELFVMLHHKGVREAVQGMAGGTSSSRQRVPKDGILSVQLPTVVFSQGSLEDHAQAREEYYKRRLREARAFQSLHEGADLFEL